MTATVIEIDADRRHFAEFLATRVLYFAQHRYAVWPFDGEGDEDVYHWARTDGNAKFRALDQTAILRHLTGERISRARFSGIGIPALTDAGWAGLGVLDIDTHVSGAIIDCGAIAAVCDPALVVTRSSSGRGVHIYAFPPALVPVNSYVLRLALDRTVSYLIGQGVLPVAETKIDKFPKNHGVDIGEPAERILTGGSVRFPFAARRRIGFNTYPPEWEPPDEHPGGMFWGGRWVEDYHERQRIIVMAQEEHLSWLATWGGPPCLGTILRDGGDEGERNTLLYDAAYFAAFATRDEALASKWVHDRIVPKLRGPVIPTRELDKTIRSGIEHALDSTKAQYVCTTTICDKDEGRCARLGQPTASGYTTGTTAFDAATSEQNQATVNVVSQSGSTALSVRDGIMYIGDTVVRVEYCPLDEKFYVHINGFLQRFTAPGVMQGSTVPVLGALLQRAIIIPKGAQRGWLTLFLKLARAVALPHHHPAFTVLKTALYTITQTEGDVVALSAISEAISSQHKGYVLEATIRHYPDADWRAVISPDNKILGMRLIETDHDFVTFTIKPPPTPVTPPPPPKESDDY